MVVGEVERRMMFKRGLLVLSDGGWKQCFEGVRGSVRKG